MGVNGVLSRGGTWTPADERYVWGLRARAEADDFAGLGEIDAVSDRGGVRLLRVTTCQLRAAAALDALLRFRLLQYVWSGLVDVALARREGWTAEPEKATYPDDVHLLCLESESGRLLSSVVVHATATAEAGTTIATRDREPFLVETVFGRVYAAVPAIAALPVAGVREVKRFAREHSHPVPATVLARAVIEPLLELAEMGLRENHLAYVGDIDPRVVGPALELTRLPTHLLAEARPLDGGAAERSYLSGQLRPGNSGSVLHSPR